MTKNPVVTGAVNVDRLYSALGDRPAAKRFFVLSLMKIDGAPQKTSLEFRVSDLVADRVYTNPLAAAHGLDLCMPTLLKMRAGKSVPLFYQMRALPDGRKLYLTPGVNLAPAAKGFRVFPLKFLDASAAKPRSKMRDLAFAVFTEAQAHVDQLATTGRFDISFRTLQDKMCLPKLSPTANFVGGKTLIDPLESAIDKLMDLSSLTGLSILPNYFEGTIGEYLDKSFLTVTFSGGLLTRFLAAFGKTEIIKPMPENVTIPCPGTNIPFWLDGYDRLPTNDPENISAQYAWLALHCDDVCYQLERGANLKYAVEDFRAVLLNLERHIDLHFAKENVAMGKQATSNAAREYYAAYALGEICFWLTPQWTIIGETVKKLSEAGALGNLTDSLAVRFCLAKTAEEKWAIASDLVEVDQKEAVSC